MAESKNTKRTHQSNEGKYTSRLSKAKEQKKHADFRLDDNFYRQLIESIDGYAVFTTDKDGNISSWNSGAEKLLGYSEKEIIGKNASIFFNEEDIKKKAPQKEMQSAVNNGSATDERWHVRKGGRLFWASGLIFPLTGENGELLGFTKVMRDRTDKKRVELEQDRFIRLFENAPAFIATLRGENHTFEMANKQYYQLVGHRDIIGRTVAEALPEVVNQGFIDILDDVIRTGKPFIGKEVRVTLQHKKSSLLEDRFVNFVYQPIYEADGTISGIFAHGVDVTEQVEARMRIEESELRFRNLADTAPMYIAMADENGNAIYFNKPWLEFTGKKLKDMLGLKWLSVLHPEDAPRFEKDFKNAFKNQSPINEQYRFKKKNGEYRWMLAVGAPRFTPDGRFIGYFGTYTDFHELKVAQLAIEASEEKFKMYTEAMPQMAFIADSKGNITYYNQRWYEYVGEVKDTEGWGWKNKQVHHPDDLDRTMKSWSHSLETGKPYEIEYRLKRYDGEYRWHLGRALPVRDDSGNITSWLGTNTDIHDQKRAMEQRDEFLGIVSHELKTPVTSIKAYGQVIGNLFRKKGDVQAAEYLQKMDSQVNKLTALINDLLDVTKIQTGRLQFHEGYFDFNEMVRSVVEDVQLTTDKHEIQLILDKTKSVFADSDRIAQVLINLITNAIKYSPLSKKIIVKTKLSREDITLCVQDFGVGIPQDKKEKVFEQFFRVSGPNQHTFPGMGLGLFISNQIIHREGGRLWVESVEGKGSKFYFSLPLKKKVIKQQKNKLAQEEIKHE